MICKMCGNVLPEGAERCEKCGEFVDGIVIGKSTGFYADQWMNDGMMGGFEAGSPAEIKNLGEYRKPKMRKSTLLGIIFGGVAAAAVIALLCIFVIAPWLTKGPIRKIQDAGIATANAESMTVRMDVMAGGNTALSGLFEMESSVKDKKLNAYFQMTVSGVRMDGYLLVDEDGGYAAVYVDLVGGYTAAKVMDRAEAKDFFDTLKNSNTSAARMYEDIGEVLAEEYGNVFDFSDFDKLMSGLIKELDKKQNREEIFRYSKEKKDGATIHSMEPDVALLLETAAEYARDRFKGDAYEELTGYIEGQRLLGKFTDASLEVGIKGKYLTSIDIKAGEGSNKAEIEMTIDNVNKTKVSVDSKAKEAIQKVK